MKKEIRDEIFNEFNKKLCEKDNRYGEAEHFTLRTGSYSGATDSQVRNFIEYVMSVCESQFYADGYKGGFRNGYDECRETYRELFTKISLKKINLKEKGE
jgi:hypothetical protein